MERVAEAEHFPESLKIECSDFRDLQIEDESVDLILTDVVWSIDSRQDWCDLGRHAAKWLRPDGLFVSYTGKMVLPYFCNEIMKNLQYRWTTSLLFSDARRVWASGMVEQWRPIVVFGKRLDTSLSFPDLIRGTGEEKEYDDWQQSLPVAITLMESLSQPGSVVLDPQLGTGTNAVAAALIGNRTFIGSDINPEKIKISRHRVATEGMSGTDEVSEYIRQVKEAGVFGEWKEWALSCDGVTNVIDGVQTAIESGWDAASVITALSPVMNSET